MEIGFIGLGQMGGAIAGNLVKAGHDVTVRNRSAERIGTLIEAGAVISREMQTDPAKMLAIGICLQNRPRTGRQSGLKP